MHLAGIAIDGYRYDEPTPFGNLFDLVTFFCSGKLLSTCFCFKSNALSEACQPSATYAVFSSFLYFPPRTDHWQKLTPYRNHMHLVPIIWAITYHIRLYDTGSSIAKLLKEISAETRTLNVEIDKLPGLSMINALTIFWIMRRTNCSPDNRLLPS